jgi:hypothetical protein
MGPVPFIISIWALVSTGASSDDALSVRRGLASLLGSFAGVRGDDMCVVNAGGRVESGEWRVKSAEWRV